ncbi:MAG: carbohydrate ABC transporter permease [Blautia faecis]
MITPTVVYSVLWIWLLDASENGVVNQLLNRFTGLGPVNWIAEYPFRVVIFAQVLTSVRAYGMTIYSSAIKSIPENQFRAAVDGAGEWEIFKQIIIPNLKPHISFIILWESLGLLTNLYSYPPYYRWWTWNPDRSVGTVCLS